ncbi:hypothetical protein [Methylopila sp. Yamaguchi]|uniref:hypothetical protein n=1 Tax=Methylopila sp. Yamaguchi TaxID=1437817 RepID=UPI000CBBC4AE|nr:hypothetical protein [Methylopila sp. Yamaguchi]GBD48105.1 hypothetical protein METY_1318 [Methylopila sp. Yamaguchi]
MAGRDVYPIDLFECGKMQCDVVGGSIEGLRSLANDTPDRFGVGRGGLWKLTYADIWLETEQEYRAWRALRARQRNGSGVMVVPVLRRLWFAQALGVPADQIPHSDGTFFSDGAGYAGQTIGASLTAAAAHGATEIQVRILGAQPLQGAEPFTIVHPVAEARLYEVAGVNAMADVVVSGQVVGYDYTIEINPPLREPTAAGTELDFDNPRCLMRLADPNGMSYEEDIVSFSSVTFLEELRVLSGATV